MHSSTYKTQSELWKCGLWNVEIKDKCKVVLCHAQESPQESTIENKFTLNTIELSMKYGEKKDI